MDEDILSKCKACGKLEVRKQDGYFPDGKNKRYIDGDKLLWNGRTCGKCVQRKSRTYIKEKRQKDKDAVSGDDSKNRDVR